MKNSLFLLLGSALLAWPSLAQINAPADKDISLPEFRQSLNDLVTMIDARRGTSFAAQFQNIPDETLARWYKAVPDGRRFQEAVREVKARSEGKGVPARRTPNSLAMAANPQRATPMAESQSPLSSPFAAGISSVVAPSFALFTPLAYPNPNTDTNWKGMAGTLQGLNALPSSLADAASSQCDSDLEALWGVLAATISGIKDAAESICNIVPDVLVVILGEGTEIPAKEICFGITLVLGVIDSAVEGFAADCDTQDRIVSGAEMEAGYNNTVALYNLKLRLKIEQNLQNTTSPIGLFELPSGLGGYLEITRAIVADTIGKMTAAGVNSKASAANTALAQGDSYYNSKNYKSAYKFYQTAYGYAVQ